jgi:two-component system sensor histidine kinase SenX3
MVAGISEILAICTPEAGRQLSSTRCFKSVVSLPHLGLTRSLFVLANDKVSYRPPTGPVCELRHQTRSATTRLSILPENGQLPKPHNRTMVLAGRRKSIAFFIALGAGLILVILLLYIGWVLLNWKNPILLFLGIVLLAMIIAGVVLNTIFLVREIRRNEQHDAFINAMTHELKTPVASIRLYLETLQSRAVDEEKRKEFYKIMLDDSDRLLQTIEQVLRTGRMGASRKLNITRIDLSQVIEEALVRARALYRLAPDALTYRAEGPTTIMGDADEVRAAVSNLIDNAVKYSGSNVKVRVETEKIDNVVALRVRDEGPGIPKTELKQIFKRFHRVPGSLATRVKGTGLGLYIVRSVAKRHGGRAWAESEGPGRGSTFVLQLPIAK